MTRSPEDIVRDALRDGAEPHPSEAGPREALRALDALVRERDDLAERLREGRAEIVRLRRIEEASRGVLDASGGRRSATPILAAMAALRAALKEQG